MPKATTAILEDMSEHLRRTGQSCMTFPWPDFYDLCGRERIKSPFLDRLKTDALNSRHQLIVADGNNVVVVCRDYNFADFSAKKTRD